MFNTSMTTYLFFFNPINSKSFSNGQIKTIAHDKSFKKANRAGNQTKIAYL